MPGRLSWLRYAPSPRSSRRVRNEPRFRTLKAQLPAPPTLLAPVILAPTLDDQPPDVLAPKVLSPEAAAAQAEAQLRVHQDRLAAALHTYWKGIRQDAAKATRDEGIPAQLQQTTPPRPWGAGYQRLFALTARHDALLRIAAAETLKAMPLVAQWQIAHLTLQTKKAAKHLELRTRASESAGPVPAGSVSTESVSAGRSAAGSSTDGSVARTTPSEALPSDDPHTDAAERRYQERILQERRETLVRQRKRLQTLEKRLCFWRSFRKPPRWFWRRSVCFARGGYGRAELGLASDLDLGYCLNIEGLSQHETLPLREWLRRIHNVLETAGISPRQQHFELDNNAELLATGAPTAGSPTAGSPTVRSASGTSQPDVNTLTSVLEGRTLCGSAPLLRRLQDRLRAHWHPEAYLRQRQQEHQALRPLSTQRQLWLKDGQGGLRDTQIPLWIAGLRENTHDFSTAALLHLVEERRWLTPAEVDGLALGLDLLHQLRDAFAAERTSQKLVREIFPQALRSQAPVTSTPTTLAALAPAATWPPTLWQALWRLIERQRTTNTRLLTRLLDGPLPHSFLDADSPAAGPPDTPNRTEAESASLLVYVHPGRKEILSFERRPRLPSLSPSSRPPKQHVEPSQEGATPEGATLLGEALVGEALSAFSPRNFWQLGCFIAHQDYLPCAELTLALAERAAHSTGIKVPGIYVPGIEGAPPAWEAQRALAFPLLDRLLAGPAAPKALDWLWRCESPRLPHAPGLLGRLVPALQKLYHLPRREAPGSVHHYLLASLRGYQTALTDLAQTYPELHRLLEPGSLQAEPLQTEPLQAEPLQAEPLQAKPLQVLRWALLLHQLAATQEFPQSTDHAEAARQLMRALGCVNPSLLEATYRLICHQDRLNALARTPTYLDHSLAAYLELGEHEMTQLVLLYLMTQAQNLANSTNNHRRPTRLQNAVARLFFETQQLLQAVPSPHLRTSPEAEAQPPAGRAADQAADRSTGRPVLSAAPSAQGETTQGTQRRLLEGINRYLDQKKTRLRQQTALHLLEQLLHTLPPATLFADAAPLPASVQAALQEGSSQERPPQKPPPAGSSSAQRQGWLQKSLSPAQNLSSAQRDAAVRRHLPLEPWFFQAMPNRYLTESTPSQLAHTLFTLQRRSDDPVSAVIQRWSERGNELCTLVLVTRGLERAALRVAHALYFYGLNIQSGKINPFQRACPGESPAWGHVHCFQLAAPGAHRLPDPRELEQSVLQEPALSMASPKAWPAPTAAPEADRETPHLSYHASDGKAYLVEDKGQGFARRPLDHPFVRIAFRERPFVFFRVCLALHEAKLTPQQVLLGTTGQRITEQIYLEPHAYRRLRETTPTIAAENLLEKHLRTLLLAAEA